MPSDSVQSLLSSTVSNFQITPDVQAISRISDHIRILKSARELERDQMLDILRSLSRRLELAKTAATAPSSPTRRSHTEKILELDREKFSLAKTINEFESAYHASEGTLTRLNEELERVKNEDVMAEASSAQQDPTILLLKIYRSLGISLEDDGMGGYAKAVVRSHLNNDIHVLSLDKTYSNFFIANYIWDMM
ncbi:Spc24 subunit of Ndc80-domain-containing protein [Lipomyces chichibuensis]|uniref:Spc24 subunit of Ndc80-domain-containing protein n=1 Tax=Lipomyces chichibuensis TaxID=1546026 RepID=UPI003342E8CD